MLLQARCRATKNVHQKLALMVRMDFSATTELYSPKVDAMRPYSSFRERTFCLVSRLTVSSLKLASALCVCSRMTCGRAWYVEWWIRTWPVSTAFAQILKALVGGKGMGTGCLWVELRVQACAIGKVSHDCRTLWSLQWMAKEFSAAFIPQDYSISHAHLQRRSICLWDFFYRFCSSQPFFSTFLFCAWSLLEWHSKGGDCASCCRKPQLCVQVRLYCISNLLSSYCK